MELSRQEYQSGLPFPSPSDLPNPGIKPKSPELQAEEWLESQQIDIRREEAAGGENHAYKGAGVGRSLVRTGTETRAMRLDSVIDQDA